MHFLTRLLLSVSISSLIVLFSSCSEKTPKELVKKKKLQALIIDGENNHGVWPMTTLMIKGYLEQTELFDVAIYRADSLWLGPHYNKDIGEDIKIAMKPYLDEVGQNHHYVAEPNGNPAFAPDFSKYDVVINNFGWKASTWPNATRTAFERYMKEGGGLVILHAANNSWGDWYAYNKMIGLGGWGGRNTDTGPYVYYNDENNKVVDPSEGPCGSHGPEMDFVMTTRAPNHPIMKNLPVEWLHHKDELYDRLRGPAENMTVLSTAYSDVIKNGPPWNKEEKGSGRHEPMLMAIEYGKGRTFHSALGHMDYSMECVGFIVTLQRGAEWAATGSVTQEIPKDFPSKNVVSLRSWKK